MTKDPFAPDAGQQSLDEDRLGELARYANLLQRKAEQVAAAEEHLKQLKQDYTQLEQESIPAFMQQLGLSAIKLQNGQTITLREEVYASISAANHAAAMDWLINTGHADLIKLTIAGTFGKEEYNLAKQIHERLQSEGAKVSSKEGVHPSTLRAFIKEQLRSGAPIPLELFGARPITKAIIK